MSKPSLAAHFSEQDRRIAAQPDKPRAVAEREALLADHARLSVENNELRHALNLIYDELQDVDKTDGEVMRAIRKIVSKALGLTRK